MNKKTDFSVKPLFYYVNMSKTMAEMVLSAKNNLFLNGLLVTCLPGSNTILLNGYQK